MKRALVATALLVLLVQCSRDAKTPGYEIALLNDMVKPVPVEAYRAPMRNPVPGTVSREPAWESPDGQTNPIPLTPEALARGKFVYENYCLICHGTGGDGDGPLIPKFPNPPPFTSRRVMELPAAQIFRVISEGKGQMASYAAQVGPEDRWKVVLYIEQLQGKSPGKGAP